MSKRETQKGKPVETKRPKGRPKYKPTANNVHQVDKSVSAYEADAGIQGLKDQPSQRGPSNIGPSAPDHSIEDSNDERMELFGGYNRYQ
ncbi:MAG: hypothetical protein EZS28_035345, partial [Streblomastix strix]